MLLKCLKLLIAVYFGLFVLIIIMFLEVYFLILSKLNTFCDRGFIILIFLLMISVTSYLVYCLKILLIELDSFALQITLILVQLLTFILSLKHIFICLICNLLRSVNWNFFVILNEYNTTHHTKSGLHLRNHTIFYVQSFQVSLRN